jgi:hypothetical protein
VVEAAVAVDLDPHGPQGRRSAAVDGGDPPVDRDRDRSHNRRTRRIGIDTPPEAVARGNVDATLGRFSEVVDREPDRRAIDDVVFEVAFLGAGGIQHVNRHSRTKSNHP